MYRGTIPTPTTSHLIVDCWRHHVSQTLPVRHVVVQSCSMSTNILIRQILHCHFFFEVNLLRSLFLGPSEPFSRSSNCSILDSKATRKELNWRTNSPSFLYHQDVSLMQLLSHGRKDLHKNVPSQKLRFFYSTRQPPEKMLSYIQNYV